MELIPVVDAEEAENRVLNGGEEIEVSSVHPLTHPLAIKQ